MVAENMRPAERQAHRKSGGAVGVKFPCSVCGQKVDIIHPPRRICGPPMQRTM